MCVTKGVKCVYYNDSGILDGGLGSSTDAWMTLLDTKDFPSVGTVKIDDELISYTSKDDTQNRLIDLTRGISGTSNAPHADESEVRIYESGYPIITKW